MFQRIVNPPSDSDILVRPKTERSELGYPVNPIAVNMQKLMKNTMGREVFLRLVEYLCVCFRYGKTQPIRIGGRFTDRIRVESDQYLGSSKILNLVN